MNNKTCPKCGKQYQVGVNGIVGSCDKCARVKRDRDGFAWEQCETEHTYFNLTTGENEIVMRNDALGDLE